MQRFLCTGKESPERSEDHYKRHFTAITVKILALRPPKPSPNQALDSKKKKKKKQTHRKSTNSIVRPVHLNYNLRPSPISISLSLQSSPISFYYPTKRNLSIPSMLLGSCITHQDTGKYPLSVVRGGGELIHGFGQSTTSPYFKRET